MDPSQMLPVFIIMALVLIGLPVLLGRITGKSPMEMFFGAWINKTRYGKKEDSGGEAAEIKSTDEAGKKGGKKKKSPPARNSTKQELLSFISSVISYARRNRFYSLVPGTLEVEGEITGFSAVVVTRARVIGFNCFGYGGDIYCEKDSRTWKQVMDGKEKQVASPVEKNRHQQELLEKALAACGFPEVRCQVFGVFTAPSANLRTRGGTNCYGQNDLLFVIQRDEYLKDHGVDPQKVGKALEGLVKRA